MDDELFNLAALAVCIYVKKNKPKKKWQKGWYSSRKSLTHTLLMEHLSLEPEDWRNYVRMNEETYKILLEMVSPLIRKHDTNMRQAITPHERLSATLRYLVSGCTLAELKFPTAISPQALGQIIPETSRAILSCLQEYMKVSK